MPFQLRPDSINFINPIYIQSMLRYLTRTKLSWPNGAPFPMPKPIFNFSSIFLQNNYVVEASRGQ